MEMASFVISNLRNFVRRRDLPPDVSGGFDRLILFRYDPSDLASPDQFWMFSHGCREDSPRNICPGCYVLDNGDSYSRLPATSTKLSGCYSLQYWCWYSCRCWLINLMAACVHVTLALRIKIMGEPSLVFAGLWIGIFVVLRLPSEKFKIVSWKKKEFKDLLFSFRLYFVTAVVSSCISTMYYSLL